MPKADSNAVAQQLTHLNRVKRLHDDRVARLYFHGAEKLPRLTNQGGDQIIARLVVKSDDKKIYAVAVTRHGLLSALEFDKALGALAGGSKFSVTPTKALMSRGHQSRAGD